MILGYNKDASWKEILKSRFLYIALISNHSTSRVRNTQPCPHEFHLYIQQLTWECYKEMPRGHILEEHEDTKRLR